MQWKADLRLASQHLTKYVDTEAKTVTFNLSAFMDAHLFLQTLMIQHSRTFYQDVSDLELQTQVHGELQILLIPESVPCYIWTAVNIVVVKFLPFYITLILFVTHCSGIFSVVPAHGICSQDAARNRMLHQRTVCAQCIVGY